MVTVSFTAVIPVHNKRPHLETCFASVLAQTRSPDEIIVVDDASTDGSRAWLETFVRKTPQVTLLFRDEPGPGGYAARNLGIAQARGEWIAFLDADDQWLPVHLERLEMLARQFPACGFLCTARHDISRDGTTRPQSYSVAHRGLDPVTFTLYDYLRASADKRNPVQTSSAAIRREVLNAAGGFPASDGSQMPRVWTIPGETCLSETDSRYGSHARVFRRGGDRDTWLRILERSDLVWDPVPSAIYRRNAVHMVTETVPHEWEQCSDSTLARMRLDPALVRRYGTGFTRAIDRVWNRERKAMARSMASQGRLSPADLKHFHFAAEPGYWLTLGLLALLPFSLQRVLIGSLRRARVTILSVVNFYSSRVRPSARSQ